MASARSSWAIGVLLWGTVALDLLQCVLALASPSSLAAALPGLLGAQSPAVFALLALYQALSAVRMFFLARDPTCLALWRLNLTAVAVEALFFWTQLWLVPGGIGAGAPLGERLGLTAAFAAYLLALLVAREVVLPRLASEG